MPEFNIGRPLAIEYAPYYGRYVRLVPAGDVLDILAAQRDRLLALLAPLDEERAGHRYAPGKWSLKELLGHLVDTERVFAFRALWFARRAAGPQPGMEQDDWVTSTDFDRRALADLLGEYEAVRAATLRLLRGFTPETLDRRGVADGNEFTVRALPYVIAGHERHHLEVLQERYF